MGSKHDLKVDVQNEDDEEAGDYLEYSQKPPRENEILWRMKARDQMSRVQRVRYYGEIKILARRRMSVQVACADTKEDRDQSEEGTRKRSFEVVTYKHENNGDWRASLAPPRGRAEFLTRRSNLSH